MDPGEADLLPPPRAHPIPLEGGLKFVRRWARTGWAPGRNLLPSLQVNPIPLEGGLGFLWRYVGAGRAPELSIRRPCP